MLIDFIFVDDGSKDTSLEILKNMLENNFFKAISLTRNFGHQVAISAGIDIVNSDYVAIIDADLQDPPELIYDMYKVSQMRLTWYMAEIGTKRRFIF